MKYPTPPAAKRLLRLAQGITLSTIALACISTSAGSQAYPTHPVKIIVPFGPGGPADVYSRAVAQKLSETFKQTFFVENRPGAGSAVGTDAAAKSTGDGYTLLAVANSHTTNETLVPKLPYELLRDFVPLAALNYSDMIFAIHPPIPAKDLRDLVAIAKQKPGAMNYASAGIGTGYHMSAELFKSMTGTNFVHVPYKNSGAARTDLISGQVQMMIDSTTTMAPNVRAGQVRALATTGKTRSPLLPDVPTMDEAGVPGYEATLWLGLVAPKGTPTDAVETLNAAIGRILRSDEIKESWSKLGAEITIMTPAEFERFLQRDIKKWAEVVKLSGATLDP